MLTLVLALCLLLALPAGGRPLGTAGIALAGREQEVAERLLAGGPLATDSRVRDVTCGRMGRQGVVAAAITPHPGFVGGLACPGAGR